MIVFKWISNVAEDNNGFSNLTSEIGMLTSLESLDLSKHNHVVYYFVDDFDFCLTIFMSFHNFSQYQYSNGTKTITT